MIKADGKVIITKTQAECLGVLLYHARCDIAWGEGGSYNTADGEIDAKAVKQAEKAIALILKSFKRKS